MAWSNKPSVSTRRWRRYADDIAEADAAFMQQFVEFGLSPGRMANLDDQRIIAKGQQQLLQARQRIRSVMERERELQQDGAEFARVEQRVASCAHQFFVFSGGIRLVSEFLPHFCGEEETRILRCVADLSAWRVAASVVGKRKC